MKIGQHEFETTGHTYVMGILNVTPDSFSDGGRWKELDNALFRVEEMIGEGTDIVDIGGESTRPGYTPLEAQEEIDRVTPIIEGVKARFDIPISLDTCKASVAQAGLEAGADLINDIWGLKGDPEMAAVIGKWGAPCCLMHNRPAPHYTDLISDMTADLRETLRLAEAGGIQKGAIILDPGVGFGKTYEHNLEVIRRMGEFHPLGCPLLLGTSRKSVIGLTLDLPADQRVEGTIATSVLAVMKGCMFVRVHDIKENVRAIRMTEAILKGGSV